MKSFMFKRIETLHWGPLIPIQYDNAQRVHVVFINTSYLTTATAKSLRTDKPRIKDPYAPIVFGVGFDGVGPHRAYENGKETRTHGVWRAMLRRCYGAEYRPAYEGATVCEDWHNFQVFAEWYKSKGGLEHSLELDKDILIKGNKLYHPERCILVSKQLNLQHRMFARDRKKCVI